MKSTIKKIMLCCMVAGVTMAASSCSAATGSVATESVADESVADESVADDTVFDINELYEKCSEFCSNMEITHYLDYKLHIYDEKYSSDAIITITVPDDGSYVSLATTQPQWVRNFNGIMGLPQSADESILSARKDEGKSSRVFDDLLVTWEYKAFSTVQSGYKVIYEKNI